MILATLLCLIQSPDQPWARHTIEAGAAGIRSGADGVRLGDANGDGRQDIVTGWEEGGGIRVYLNPGPDAVRSPWPAVTVGDVRSPEDAVFADLDGDGNLDVVSCTEGRTRTVYFHFAPERSDILRSDAWETVAVPATAGREQWMFALPYDVDGRHGIDLVIGSKNKGSVSWLRAPAKPRQVADWELHRIVDAGWIMSIRASAAGVWVSDRKGPSRGVFELVIDRDATSWSRRDVGGADHEVMFLDVWPGSAHPIVATRNGVLLDLGKTPREIPNPFRVKHGKAVALGDIDSDGEPDIVHTVNRGKQRQQPAVTVIASRDQITWDIGGPDGTKFDRIELLDLDGDGDLDVLTCEENAGEKSTGLGVIWYENPTRTDRPRPTAANSNSHAMKHRTRHIGSR